MARWWRIAALGPFLLLDGCYFFAKPPPPPKGPPEHGIASWYGPGFHGKRTSSGVVFDQDKLTAAHPTLPLGSRVLVTNKRNGKKVEVVINDRGPFVSGRVIDLSRAAAERLGMLGPGTTPVSIELVALPPDGSRRVSYAVQVERARRLVGLGWPAFVVEENRE